MGLHPGSLHQRGEPVSRMGSLHPGYCIQGGLHAGGVCIQRGFHQEGSASRGSASRGSLHQGGVCIRGDCIQGVGIQGGSASKGDLAEPPRPKVTVNERAVRILLECILAFPILLSPIL